MRNTAPLIALLVQLGFSKKNMPIFKKKIKKNPLLYQELGFDLDVFPLIEKDTEFHCLSVGQFNLIDVVENVINQIGRCKIDIAVWTAAETNLKKAFNFLESENVESMRWLIDPSFKSRQPKYVATLASLFGDDAVRTIPTHAKFIVCYNEVYSVTILTSMNLNQNKRLENFTVIENYDMCKFYSNFVDQVFNKKEAADNFQSQDVNQANDLFDEPIF